MSLVLQAEQSLEQANDLLARASSRQNLSKTPSILEQSLANLRSVSNLDLGAVYSARDST